jgi:hypothetical protein
VIMKILIMGKAWECSQRGSACFELQRKGEPTIAVRPSPSGDGSWGADRRFLLTFHVDAHGNLALGKPPKATDPAGGP